MFSFKAIIGFLFASLIATIAILTVVAYKANDDVASASLSVNHGHQVIEKAEEISSTYKDARLAMNIIIIRHDTSRNADYGAAMKVLPTYIEELRRLSPDNDQQQTRIDSLENELAKFKDSSDTLIGMVAAELSRDSIFNVFTISNGLRDDITRRIDTIRRGEMTLLERLQAASRETIAGFNRTFISLLVGTAVLLGSTFLVIRYNFNKRIRTQKELSRTKMLFEKVFYESPIAIVISDLETDEILNCNMVFTQIVNFDRSDLIGKNAVELGIFQSQEKRNEVVSGAKQNDMSRHAEVYIKPRDREPIYISFHSHVIPLYDRDCLLTAILDLTTHKRAEEEIMKAFETERELNGLKSNFVTLASHEFKTPLTTILSSAFLLEKYSFGENQGRATKHVARIKSTVKNLVSILDEFLSVAKIEEGRIQPHAETIDLPKYVESICKNLQTFARPGQVIHYDHTGESEIQADPVLVANILNNLVSNSIKYSEENSPIYVTSVVNSKVHLMVKDCGIGIPDKDQKHLFERFYRASNAGAIQGTGLGLHIMKHYVEMMSGAVKLTSEVGKGTEVSVTFDNIRRAPS